MGKPHGQYPQDYLASANLTSLAVAAPDDAKVFQWNADVLEFADVPAGSVTGLGTMATQNANNVNISGGAVAGTSLSDVNGAAIRDATNIAFGTTTGTKIGTAGGASGQKMAFWNSSPIVQPVLATGAGHSADDIITVLQTLGLVRQS